MIQFWIIQLLQPQNGYQLSRFTTQKLHGRFHPSYTIITPGEPSQLTSTTSHPALTQPNIQTLIRSHSTNVTETSQAWRMRREVNFSKGYTNAYSSNSSTDTAQIKTNADPRIHPIFCPDKFPPELDYKMAFQEAALLASRLLKSQQSYHWLFAVWYGDNKQSRVPHEFRNMSSPNVPEEYTTNRGTGELTSDERCAVDDQLIALSQRVKFKLLDKQSTKHCALAVCQRGRVKRGQQSCRPTIWIGRELYDVMTHGKGRHLPHHRASFIFLMATTLLHEMAHAASFHIMGHRPEDFFEDALVAEAGFEYVSQIFGMVPIISCTEPLNRAWMQWQNLSFLYQKVYPVNKKCRNTPKLSTVPTYYHFDANFAMRLLSDEWWGKSADRSTDLIPNFLLRRENAHLLATAPASIRDWIHGTAHRQHKATEIPHSRLRPRLRVRQPTPSSYFTASTLEADPESSIKDSILCHEPLPLP